MLRLQTLQSKLFYAMVRSRLRGLRRSQTEKRVIETIREGRDDDRLYSFLHAAVARELPCCCNRCRKRVRPRAAVRVQCDCLVQIMHEECSREYHTLFSCCAMCQGKIHSIPALN